MGFAKNCCIRVIGVICATITCSGLLGAPTTHGNQDSARVIAGCTARPRLSSEEFASVLQAIQKAWLTGDAERAAGCFTTGAIFSLPPSFPVIGRANLLQVFGANQKSVPPKNIEWHHLVFDPAQQVGAVEFSIQRRIPTHGVVFIKFSGGLISNWREYSIASDLTWNKFVGANSF